MMDLMQNVVQRINDEQEVLDELAHEVAKASSVEKMVASKSSYDLQKVKLTTLYEVMDLINKHWKENSHGTSGNSNDYSDGLSGN